MQIERKKKKRKPGKWGMDGWREGSVRLTSVPVCGLVKHEHGIVDLRRDKQDAFLHNAGLPRGILPDLSPSQVLQGGSATDGQKGGREGGEGTGEERQVTKGKPRGQETGEYAENRTTSPGAVCH